MRVLKWPIKLIAEPQRIGSGEVLYVNKDGSGDICVWTWESEDSALVELRRIVQIFGTGHTVPEGFKHIGSTKTGPFVWHLFERVVS